MSVARPGLGQDARELPVQPAQDGFVVVSPRALLRLLTASVEAALEDLADVLGVETDPEVSADECGDARGRPEIVEPTVGGGPLQEEVLPVDQLVVAQARGRTRMGLGSQALGMGAGLTLPAVERVAASTEDARDVRGGLALVQEIDGTPAAAFEFSGASNRSAHA
jgi:hypothetical protein